MSVIRILKNVPRWPAFVSISKCRRFSENTVLKWQREQRAARQICTGQQSISNLVLTLQHPERRNFSSTKTLFNIKPPSDKYLVYKGSLTNVVHITKLMSLSSSLVGLVVQPYLIGQATGVHLAVAAAVGSMVCFFTYVTPLLIHWVTKRYVVCLHFDPKTGTFTCTTLSFFLYRNLMEFKASDVVIPDIPGVFTSMLVKGKPLLIDPSSFLDIEAYRHLMGFDKPLDLKLGNPDDKQS